MKIYNQEGVMKRDARTGALLVQGEVEFDERRFPAHVALQRAQSFDALLGELRSAKARPLTPLQVLMFKTRIELLPEHEREVARHYAPELVAEDEVAVVEFRTRARFDLVACSCTACGRKLVLPESVERGMGPDCFKNYFSGAEDTLELDDQSKAQIRELVLLAADTQTTQAERVFVAECIDMLGAHALAARIKKRSKAYLRELERANQVEREDPLERLGEVAWSGRKNLYPSPCACCKEEVEAGEGLLGRSALLGYVVACSNPRCHERLGVTQQTDTEVASDVVKRPEARLPQLELRDGDDASQRVLVVRFDSSHPEFQTHKRQLREQTECKWNPRRYYWVWRADVGDLHRALAQLTDLGWQIPEHLLEELGCFSQELAA